MRNNRKILTLTALAGLSLFTYPLQGQTTWTGTTSNDLSDSTNWDNGIPNVTGAFPDGLFTGAATSPFLTSGTFINPLSLQVSLGNYTYSVSNTASLQFGQSGAGDTRSGGFNTPAGLVQTFNIDTGGEVFFLGNTTVNATNNSDVVFNLTNGSLIEFSPDAGNPALDINATFNLVDNASQMACSGNVTTTNSIINSAGVVSYINNGSSAGSASITLSSQGDLGFANGNVTAGQATIVMNDATILNFSGGGPVGTQATAGTSNITLNNNPSVTFADNSTAGSATITSSSGSTILIQFGVGASDTATAGSSTINLNGGGGVSFTANTTAGSAIVNSNSVTGIGFTNSSSAGSATFNFNGQTAGAIEFGSLGGTDTATANTATFNMTSAFLIFNADTTAATSTISLGSSSTGGFNDSSTASGSTIGVNGGSILTFNNSTTAATSAITLDSSTATFNNTSTASTSTIDLGSASTLTFNNSSLAATSTINLGGSSIAAFNASSSAGSSSISVDNTSSVTFNQSVDSTYSGILSGAGSVQLISNVNQLFTGNSSAFSGTTTVNAGKLKMNGSLGGTTTMNNATTLTGTGTLHNLLINSGATIAPGNSIGTLFVTGNYSQSAGSFYNVQINDEGQSSLIDITGSATLNGGTVQVTTLDTVNLAQRYTILHANGGVHGTFSGVTFPSAILAFSLVYDPNNVYLQVGNQVVFRPLVRTINQLHVAIQLENLFNDSPDPSQLAFLDTLIPLSTAEIDNVLDLLSGVQYTSILEVGRLANRRFLRQLYDPLRYDLAYGQCRNDCDCDCVDGVNYQVWTDFEGGRAFFEGNENAKGFNDYNYNESLGAQTYICDDLILGAAAGYEYDHLKYNLAGHGRVHTAKGALYGAFTQPDFYVFTDLVGGWSDFKVVRPIRYSTNDLQAHGNTHLYDATWYGEGGYNLNWNCLLIQPFAGIDVSYYRFSHVHETGTDVVNLDIHGKAIVETDSYVGGHFLTALGGDVIFSTDLAWVHRFRDRDHSIGVNFQGFGDEFTILGINDGRNGFEGAVTVSKTFCDNLTLYAEFSGEVWKHLTNYEGTLGLLFDW